MSEDLRIAIQRFADLMALRREIFSSTHSRISTSRVTPLELAIF